MTAAVGWFGDTLLTNGAITRNTLPRVVGCACVCSMAVSPLAQFRHQRQSPALCDCQRGGLLPEPVKVNELPVLMGERLKCWWRLTTTNPLTW